VDYLDKLIAQGPPGASAMDFSNTVGNAAASLCGIEFGLRGANVTLNYREASALSAVAYAISLLRAGQTRIVVTGGVDDIESVLFAVHDEFGVLAFDEGHGETSRPFDRRRNGFVLGSGAYFLILESLSSARDRGAPYYGQIAGVGATASRCRLNDWPREASQLARCMRDALDSACLHPQDIDVVFAAANSTTRLDRLEAEALSCVFGPAGVPVVALKGALGECGATGAASLLAALQCLQRGVIPPTVGFEEPDAECPVDIAADARPLRRSPGQLALVNSFASGGANYSIVVRR
jgi:3-oxoacyl-[acyl-carrier-protein] synthase II